MTGGGRRLTEPIPVPSDQKRLSRESVKLEARRNRSSSVSNLILWRQRRNQRLGQAHRTGGLVDHRQRDLERSRDQVTAKNPLVQIERGTADLTDQSLNGE